jgi:threonine dehydrogenase-like Zn-dependent dehydrogenase
MMIYFGKHPRAKAPLAMGHEFSGVIEEINSESLFNVGDRIVIEPTISCGKCKMHVYLVIHMF